MADVTTVHVEPVGLSLVLIVGVALLIGLLVLVGNVFGKKPALAVAIGSVVLVLLAGWVQIRRAAPVLSASPNESIPDSRNDAVAGIVVESSTVPPPDRAVQAYALFLSEQTTYSNRMRPTWADQAPGLDHGVYRWPVRSGRFSTLEECRQALAVAVAQAVNQYGQTYLADIRGIVLLPPDWFRRPVRFENAFMPRDSRITNSTTTSDAAREIAEVLRAESDEVKAKLDPFPTVTSSGRTGFIEQPLYAETVKSTVGPMQELYVLLEFGDYARAQMREALRRAAIPLRFRWAAAGFAAVLAIIGLLLAALRFDVANGGKHRGRLRWATALTILLVVGSAWGLCLL